ncbi:protein unc-80 homolog [Ischnura elegans]|uniref:protein unc-80 homolog n=1 Tax=Ischnura elegans TaxID=197161 RepID=UPI001ED8BCC4|nr:protein unc-80 homolog [Ischnura elegans]
MERRSSYDDSFNDQALPIPIQIFLWRQTSPFIRPKLGKLHEASCMFCQHAPGHHELKEACKSFEKVLVQNIQFGLSPSLTEAIRSIPRWRLVQAAFPHVMHCAATLLHNRRDTNLVNLGAAETKLLYTLHWIILDAAEECADADYEKGIIHSSPFYYLFSIPSISLFIYLFAPICHHLKESDFQTFRLENGLKIWQALWDYHHPDTPCFTAHCKPKPRALWDRMSSSPQPQFGDVFLGGVARKAGSDEGGFGLGESPPCQSGGNGTGNIIDAIFISRPDGAKQPLDDESNWLSSPKETAFPETIPEESSSTEEEHVVIFRLPSLPESDGLKESSIFTVTAISGSDTKQQRVKTQPTPKKKEVPPEKEPLPVKTEPCAKSGGITEGQSGRSTLDLCAATFLDVAVLRCLFVSQWQEEGVYWALQFLYHRLREINDETFMQQQPKRRSNSLPIPKIEVSIYQSPELKKRESKDFMEVPEVKDVSLLTESPYHGHKHSDEQGSHSRRSSEKVKKRMKMADLKAFVETKLLSKSEKTLEKIGREESKTNSLFDQDCHHSLDTGDEHLSRPCSALAKIFEPKADQCERVKPPSNLVKGKSMPSLSCLIDELTGGYIGEVHPEKPRPIKGPCIQTHTIPNPIITVTEHTPTPSPEYMRRQGSIDSQLDAISLQGKKCPERKPSLTRSQTDSNITYAVEEMPEAAGSVCYITKDGDIDYQVVLKAVHSAAIRDNICTLRVCEVILNLCELLMDMGVLKQCLREEAAASSGAGGPSEMSAPSPGNSGWKDATAASEGETSGTAKEDAKEQSASPHSLIMNCVVRVLKHLGCPHGCSDGQRGPPADFLRSQGQSILTKLHRASEKQFSRFLRDLVNHNCLSEVMDFFHAYVGFCVDPSSLLSPLNQKRNANKSPDTASGSAGYATNFGANIGRGGSRGIESHIISNVFKSLVSRMVNCSKELKSQENVALYGDVRQLMTYIKEAHGGVFRRVALSGLLDSANRPNKGHSNQQSSKAPKNANQPEVEEQSDRPMGSCYIMDERGGRKFLFKKRSTSSTFPSLAESEIGEEVGVGTIGAAASAFARVSQSPIGNIRKKHHILTPRQSERNMGALGASDPTPSTSSEKSKKTSRFPLVNWFRRDYGKTDQSETHDDSESPVEGTFNRQPSLHHSLGRSVEKVSVASGPMGNTLLKAKKRMEDHLKNIGFGKGKKRDGGFEETTSSYLSRRNSIDFGMHSRDSEFVVLKERKLVPLQPVFNGMLRFSFILETCHPGSVPDPHLLAAALDLPHAPVVSRASFLLECAYFVHCCNKGQWPAWMKHNFPVFRQSGPHSSRTTPSGMRRTHVLQKAAGKMFFQWAEAIGARLEEMVMEDRQNVDLVSSMVSDETKQKELLLQDEEEDFLDEASVHVLGSDCPIALRLVACILLLEVTAFLRETYQTLPKSGRAPQGGRGGGGGIGGGVSSVVVGGGMSADRGPLLSGGAGISGGGPWDRIYNKEANRRWSMALSSMGHSQTSAQSLQSIAGDRDGGMQSERKISFVLHEPDNESEGSSNTTVTMQLKPVEYGEEMREPEEKKTTVSTTRRIPQGRPFLLRRGTGGGPTAPPLPSVSTGSFKRRSLKLRRAPAKEVVKQDLDCDFRRQDSIQSKRKVSSLSDRSDTSDHGGEHGEVSGEESPGVLSDDQPPESPSDSNEADDIAITKNMPWMRVVVLVANSFNFYCSHQSFCHPYCYRRHMRACSRLIKSVRKVYGEEFGIIGGVGVDIQDDKQHQENAKKDKLRGRKVSDQTSTQASPIRRKDSFGKRDRADKTLDSGQTNKLGGYKDSSRDIADSESEMKGKDALLGFRQGDKGKKDTPPILKYIKTQVRDVFHAPMSVLVKGAVVLAEEHFIESLPLAWELLLESSQEVAASAAALFILGAVRAPVQATHLIHGALQDKEPAGRINAILRFQVLWKLRYQVWPRMEDGAHLTFKVPPPGIEFTLPSPKIGIEMLPVVDPPWMPQVKTKVEEVTISQESHRSLVTATKTRKKQQTELIKLALQAEEDKKRVERENFLITTIPITVQAAYEPSLYHAIGDDHDEVDEEQPESQQRSATHHVHSAHSLFPSCLCSAVIEVINLLDDAAVSPDGNAVYEVAYQVIWNCLVEDSALFLRYVLERLTREKQDLMFKVLRHLIRFVPKLPQQAAFALYNYIIGYVMFYVRTPQEGGQMLIGTALSILWMVVHSVHGIMFKDLKQILRKEQCDASILLTANVPSAKKIIVHGPQDDAGGIPSQFPVQEDTQFCQILRESLDFFGIDEARHKEFFLVDHKTHQIHNPSAYVRDFYFFKRSQYPQLALVHMEPDEAYNALQKQALILKFVEIGKVLLTWAILKNVDMVVQRVVFLHEELMKLPSFPRKALESDIDLYKGGEMGKELLGLDMLHKFMWVRLIARMFEAMAGNFAYSGDIHLFLNVLNGALILHSEDSCILRYVMATYINAAHNFKNIFSTNGYLLIMPTLLQIYSNHQTNTLVTRTIEYAVKQFYLMNRKPFILQMFGSVSSILDTDEDSQYGDAHKVPAKCLFNLLLSLETPSPDPLNIGELVKEEKPLKAIDFCYHDENEMVTVLDCISLCVMVVAYAADSVRGHQMLTILEAILPCYLQRIQSPQYKKEVKTEKEIINQLAVTVKTLVNNCEALAKNYTGPQKASPDHKGSSQRNYSRGPYSPGFDFDEDSHSKYVSDHGRSKAPYERDLEDSEILRNEFRRPRDILLSMVAEFLTKCNARLTELNKKSGQEGKPIELLDIKSHVRLADVAHSLLKVSPYDPDTMACRGLQRYMNEILPSTEWANEAMRPALITILRRLDKTFNKIYKKPSIRRHTDWDAAAGLLKGIYETLSRYPYIVHMQHLKTLFNTCQALIVGESSSTGLGGECISSATTALMSQVPPPHFCSTVVRLIALQILAIGETYSLEQVCGGGSVFPTHEKTENMLMNLIMPMCLRVGSGRKDAPKMRQADISFALTIILHAMNPPATKTAPVTAQNIKTASEMRTGSLYSSRDSKVGHKIPHSLYQVSFLALKIIMVCFESELVLDWPRISRTIKELGRRNECGGVFWNFIDFVVTQRCPLFILLMPFIMQKLAAPPSCDSDRHTQFVIREKMQGFSLPAPKSKGSLLMELAHEMKELKEEIEDRKYEQDAKRRAGGDGHSESQTLHVGGHHPTPARHRPSIIELFTGGSSSGGDSGRFQHGHQATDTQPLHKATESMSSASFDSTQSTLNRDLSEHDDDRDDDDDDEGEVHASSCTGSAVVGTGPTDLSLQASSDDHVISQKSSFLPQQVASQQHVASTVENRYSSGDTSTTPLSPSSPIEEGSVDIAGHPKPRLQRSKAQSRKTLRLRKSRKSHIEVSHIKVEPQEIPRVAGSQVHSDEPLELSVAGMPTAHAAGPSHSSVTSSTAMTTAPSAPPPATKPKIQHQPSIRKADPPSWDEDSAMSQTSSTSGYRENLSTAERYGLLVLESPPLTSAPLMPSCMQHTRSSHASSSSVSKHSQKPGSTVPLLASHPHPPHTPPLASPDMHELASTSSTSREASGHYGSPHNVPGGSSVESLNSGEDTALLKKSHKGDSHQSLLMAFETQDEDTLI